MNKSAECSTPNPSSSSSSSPELLSLLEWIFRRLSYFTNALTTAHRRPLLGDGFMDCLFLKRWSMTFVDCINRANRQRDGDASIIPGTWCRACELAGWGPERSCHHGTYEGRCPELEIVWFELAIRSWGCWLWFRISYRNDVNNDILYYLRCIEYVTADFQMRLSTPFVSTCIIKKQTRTTEWLNSETDRVLHAANVYNVVLIL